MKLKLLTISFLIFFLIGCGGGESGGTGGGNGLVTFTILVSANCQGRFSSVEVFFDDRRIATLVPGNSTTIDTTPGEHRIEASAENGVTFGPFTRVIEFSGGTLTLTCS
ncbi:MAG: hypothetical protein AAF197_03535 [Pseudomonadota bacterium]